MTGNSIWQVLSPFEASFADEPSWWLVCDLPDPDLPHSSPLYCKDHLDELADRKRIASLQCPCLPVDDAHSFVASPPHLCPGSTKGDIFWTHRSLCVIALFLCSPLTVTQAVT
eukprot:GGOE01026864.1.p4 GENE.GGOE01026864.1~~GGOE01026864.1.p4  ORF type:complete len:113 (+),score=8.82 GGOE01026864.1:742-1080(+)